jgi:hypothetical protein
VTATPDEVLALIRAPWQWQWVPGAARGADVRAAWTGQLTAQFAEWTRAGMAEAHAAWPGEAGPCPITGDLVGQGVASWLLERADRLPPWARLAWGAVFLDERPRWAPVPVVVEFRRPAAADPVYLMDEVGAAGRPGDAREPVVDYVTTPAGDGVRVFALARTVEGAGYGRLDAALRLEVPTGDGAAGDGADVILTTVVFELGLMALIGPGVEQLMQRIAAECAPGSDGTRGPLAFRQTSAGGDYR